MKLMRNIRTGKKAVYDESCIATGRWEPVPTLSPFLQQKRKEQIDKKQKPQTEQQTRVKQTDSVEQKEPDESLERQA